MTPRRALEQRLAEIFEQARLDLGLTQAELSERARRLGYDVTQVQVSRVLRGAVPMKVEDADALARALGMSLSGALRIIERTGVTAGSEVIGRESDPPAIAAHRRRPRPVTGRRRAT